MAWRDLVSRDARRMALGGAPVEYMLVRRRGRRGVGLKVDENGLSVSAPVTMPLSQVESLVRESERWVLRKVAEWSKRRAVPLEWIEGARLPFLGGALVLRLGEGSRARALRKDEELRVTARAGEPSSGRDA